MVYKAGKVSIVVGDDRIGDSYKDKGSSRKEEHQQVGYNDTSTSAAVGKGSVKQ